MYWEVSLSQLRNNFVRRRKIFLIENSKLMRLEYILKYITMTWHMHNMCVLFNLCDMFHYHDIWIAFMVGLAFEASCLYPNHIVFKSMHLTYNFIWLNNLLKSFISKWMTWTFSLYMAWACSYSFWSRSFYTSYFSKNDKFEIQTPTCISHVPVALYSQNINLINLYETYII